MCAILNNLIYANFYFQYKLDIHRHEKWPLDSISDLLNFLSSTHLWPIVVGFLCPLWVCLSWMCVLGGFLSDLIRPAGFTRLAASGAAWLRFRQRFRLRLRMGLRLGLGPVGQQLGFECRRGWADWLDRADANLLHMAALSSRRRLPGRGGMGMCGFSKHSNDSSSGEKFCFF